MKREETYCDVCGKQMSYQDVDGDACMEGITMQEPLILDVDTRHDCGTTASRHAVHHKHFCSYACLEPQIAKAMRAVSKDFK